MTTEFHFHLHRRGLDINPLCSAPQACHPPMHSLTPVSHLPHPDPKNVNERRAALLTHARQDRSGHVKNAQLR